MKLVRFEYEMANLITGLLLNNKQLIVNQKLSLKTCNDH